MSKGHQAYRFAALLFGLAIFYGLTVYVAIFVIGILTSAGSGGPSIGPTQGIAAHLCAVIALLQVLRWTAPRVGYRSVDALIILVPGLNVYFLARVLWRLAAPSVRLTGHP